MLNLSMNCLEKISHTQYWGHGDSSMYLYLSQPDSGEKDMGLIEAVHRGHGDKDSGGDFVNHSFFRGRQVPGQESPHEVVH